MITLYDDTGMNEDLIVDKIVFSDENVVVGILKDNSDNFGKYVMISRDSGEVVSSDHRFYYANMPV